MSQCALDSETDSSDADSLLQMWLALPALSAVGVSALVWGLVLLIFWLNPWCPFEMKKQGADRGVSMVHAIVTSLLGLIVEFRTVPRCIVRNHWTSAPMLVFLGFLAIDLLSIIICEVWQRWRQVDKGVIFHHVFILVWFTWGYYEDVGVWFGSALLINELSTPCVNIFWYLQYTGRKETQAFMINGALLLFLFFLCRVVYIPINVYHFWSCGLCAESANRAYLSLRYVMIVGYIAIYVLNLTWFYKILCGSIKAYKKSRKTHTPLLEARLGGTPPTPAVQLSE